MKKPEALENSRFLTLRSTGDERIEVWNGSAKRGDACAEISRRGTMRVLSGTCPSCFREKDGIPGSAEESGICGFCDGGIEKTHRK